MWIWVAGGIPFFHSGTKNLAEESLHFFTSIQGRAMGATQISLDQVIDDPVVEFVVFCPRVDGHIQIFQLFFNNLQSLFAIHFDMLRMQRIAG